MKPVSLETKTPKSITRFIKGVTLTFTEITLNNMEGRRPR